MQPSSLQIDVVKASAKSKELRKMLHVLQLSPLNRILMPHVSLGCLLLRLWTFSMSVLADLACALQILIGGGQEASQVTTTSSRAGRFESRFFHKVCPTTHSC